MSGEVRVGCDSVQGALVSHEVIGQKQKQALLEQLFAIVALGLYHLGLVEKRFAVGKVDLELQHIGRLVAVAEEKYARGWKVYLVWLAGGKRLLERDGEVVLDHANYHARVVRALAFYVIDLVLKAKNGVVDEGAAQLLVLIAELDNGRVGGILPSKCLVDKGNNELRCLVHHRLEYGIKNSVVCHASLLKSMMNREVVARPRRGTCHGRPP